MALTQTVIGWTIDDEGIADRVGVYVFEHDDTIDVEETIRKTISEYLKTPEGIEDNEDLAGDFNWGDAAGYEDLLAKAGVKLVANYASDFVVNHDELLAD